MNRIKFFPLSCLAALAAAALTGCGNSDPAITGVSPETSALALYQWDGDPSHDLSIWWLYDTPQEQEIIDAINAAPKTSINWEAATLDARSGDLYALALGSEDGSLRYYSYWDGLWFDSQGNNFQMKLDFPTLQTGYDWETATNLSPLTYPNLYRLAREEAGWNTAFLPPVSDLSDPFPAALEVLSLEGDSLTVSLSNGTGEELSYGYAYSLHIQLDGVWYAIPTEKELSVNEIALLLPPGGSTQETYDLSPYGDLPPGRYRISIQGATAEFDVT